MGNERGEDEADAVHRCPYAALRIGPPNLVIFDFFGKDSIRYYNRASVQELHTGQQDSDGCVNVSDAESTPVSCLTKLPSASPRLAI